MEAKHDWTKFGQKGGLIRAAKLSPEQRKAIASRAACARWPRRDVSATGGAGSAAAGNALVPPPLILSPSSREQLSLRTFEGSKETTESSVVRVRAHARGNGWGTPEALVELYNAAPGSDECPAVEQLTPGRRAKAQRYLKMFPERAYWARAMQEIARSRFLRGLSPRDGHGSFRATFDWLLTKGKDGTENVAKVVEGQYRDEGRPLYPLPQLVSVEEGRWHYPPEHFQRLEGGGQ